MNWKRVLWGTFGFAVMVGLLSGCSSRERPPYYSWGSDIGAQRAAVTKETIVLVHLRRQAMEVTLPLFKEITGVTFDEKSWVGFLMNAQLQELQLSFDGVDANEQPQWVLTVTFGKTVEGNELVKLLGESGKEVIPKDEGEFQVGHDGWAVLTGEERKVLYLGTKAQVRDAAEAYKKRNGGDMPKRVVSSLRSGDDLYVVVKRDYYLLKLYRDRIPAKFREMIGTLPDEVGLAVKLGQDMELVGVYKDAGLPEAAEGMLKGVGIKAKEKVVTITLEGDRLNGLRELFRLCDGKSSDL